MGKTINYQATVYDFFYHNNQLTFIKYKKPAQDRNARTDPKNAVTPIFHELQLNNIDDI